MAYTKKKNYTKKQTISSALVKKVNKMVKEYKPETKVHDAGIASQSVTFSGICQNITAVSAGDGQTNRDGHAISVNSISFKASILWNSSANAQSFITLYLVQDLQQIADSSPTFSDVFKSSDGPLCLINRENFGRFKILKKVRVVQDGTRQSFIDFHHKCVINVRYNNVSSGDYQKNGLYIVAASDRLLQTPLMTWQSRITYTDN